MEHVAMRRCVEVAAEGRTPSALAPKNVADGVWQLPLRGVNAYALETAQGTVLVDAGNRGDGERILAMLRVVGLAPPGRILLTHADMDHAGGVRAILQVTTGEVHASRLQADVLAGHGRPPALRRFGRLLTGRIACEPDLEEGARVAGLLVVATPGHTAGHVALLREDDRVVFAGDALAVRGAKVRILGAPLTEDFAQACASLRRLAQLQPNLVLPGHGDPLPAPAHALEAALRICESRR